MAWALMIVNNKGITKELHLDQQPVIDASATQSVGISFQGTLARAAELIYDDKLRIDSNGAGIEPSVWAQALARAAAGNDKPASAPPEVL